MVLRLPDRAISGALHQHSYKHYVDYPIHNYHHYLVDQHLYNQNNYPVALPVQCSLCIPVKGLDGCQEGLVLRTRARWVPSYEACFDDAYHNSDSH
jgi:hypothetical protein